MAEAGNTESLRTVWQRLSTSYEWKLVSSYEIERLLERAKTIIDELDFASSNMRKLAEIGIVRAYSEQLYRALLERKQQAAAELWQLFRRSGLRDFSNEQEAEEIAQEAVVRVLKHLDGLKQPQSLITWAFRIFKTVKKEYLARIKKEQEHSKQTHASQEEDQLEAEYADPVDLFERIDQVQVDQQLMDALKQALPKELERYVILRVVALGAVPRDLALELGLQPHYIRLTKSRALKRLRENTAFMHLLKEITGLAEFAQGATYDPSETE
jgi:RNA polymerase sigma factor (sigma-70 family)